MQLKQTRSSHTSPLCTEKTARQMHCPFSLTRPQKLFDAGPGSSVDGGGKGCGRGGRLAGVLALPCLLGSGVRDLLSPFFLSLNTLSPSSHIMPN